jgi:hypothetical protein
MPPVALMMFIDMDVKRAGTGSIQPGIGYMAFSFGGQPVVIVVG